MKKMLVVYYSWSNGNTKRIAEQLTNGTGADIARIETAEPYSGSHEDVVEQGKREVEAGFMPQINPISVNLADYDVIATGTPTWWYMMAPAVLTFLTTNDFTGKTVVPFMTNGGWLGHVIKDMKENCKGAAFAHEIQIQFDSMGKDHLETSEDALEFIMAGAKAVAVGTANFHNPYATIEIIDGIWRYMKENKISSLEEIRGCID